MTDYDWSIGSNGTMRIRDTGTYVEFWITANNTTTSASALPWGYTVNGVTDNTNAFDYNAGAYWERLGRWLVTTDQTVTFRLFETGTSGLGSGETHSVAINRTSAPAKPPRWMVEQIWDTRVQGDVDGADTGGLTLDEFQVRYSLSSSASSPMYQSDTNLDGYFTISGLARGTRYYFWVRTHNSKGWSPWSDVVTAVTHNYPPAPTAPVLSEIKQTSVKAVFSGNGDGGSAALEWQIGYGLSSSAPTNWVTGYNLTISGLEAGQKYYFWARGRNTYGWGPYSARSEATLYAGAWIDVAGVKKRAVPYVKVAGVWKPAESWARIAGLWKVSG